VSLFDREPGLADAGREVARLLRRAAARPVLVLGLAGAITLAVVAKRVLAPPTYPGQVVLRVTENADDPGARPRPVGRLREHVNDAVFTAGHLLPILRRHGLEKEWLERDENHAIERFKDDLSVATYRNFFLQERYEGDPARSARIAIRYRHADPVVAIEVARELAELVIRQESEGLVEQLQAALAGADDTLARARQEVEAREVALAEAARGAAEGKGSVELAQLQQAVERATRQLADAQRFRGALDLSIAAERRRLGVRFDVVEPGFAARPETTWLVLLALCAGIFAASLPIVAITVGAFDRRIRHEDDVRRLGLRIVGHVPAHRGNEIGSFADRRGAMDAVH
jgi:hypothetical protein